MRVWLLVLPFLASVACLFPSQKASLVNFYNATAGPSWTSTLRWNAGDPCANAWEGVFCDSLKDNVITLTLPNNGLAGTLPDLDLPLLGEL